MSGLAVAGCGPARGQPAAGDCTAQVDVELGPARDGQPVGPVLAVAMACRSASPARFLVDGPSTAAALASVRDGGDRPIERDGVVWEVPPQAGVATLRYRLDLGALARDINRVSVAVARGEAVLAIASTWLVEPRLQGVATPAIDLTVTTPPGVSFLAGLPQSGGVWRLRGTTVRFVGYTVFGRLATERVAVPPPSGMPAGQPAHLDLAIFDGAFALPRADLVEWVRRTVLMTAGYWDGFTNPSMLVALLPTPGRRGVGYGRTVPGGGSTVMVQVGERSTLADLQDDWVLPHEFVHTGMPFLRGNGTWFMEGAATYIEPIIRARAGWKSEADVWREWVENMPRGLSALRSGMSGGSPYWGGALFFLLADIEIRRSTGGTKGLEDCFRGARRLGGPMTSTERWSIDQYVERCDAALGRPLMAGIVTRYLGQSTRIDLDALWRDLGVRLDGTTVITDDAAPLAAIRKMIVAGAPGRPQTRVPPLAN
ncbi:MAG: hypothetical protein KIT36_15720 [Alphaproteobacteria bacterium]|nr:hypothetical protein [Alphaproteobacteria bacterium]